MFIATFLLIPAFVFSGDLISILFRVDNSQVNFMAQLFLISMFCTVVCRNIPFACLQMTQHHKMVGYTTMFEACANVAANLVLLNFYEVEIVLVNSIAIKLLMDVFFVLPFFLKTMKISAAAFVWNVYAMPFAVSVPAWALTFAPLYYQNVFGRIPTIALGSIMGAAIYLVLSYAFILTDEEKFKFKSKACVVAGKLDSLFHKA